MLKIVLKDFQFSTFSEDILPPPDPPKVMTPLPFKNNPFFPQLLKIASTGSNFPGVEPLHYPQAVKTPVSPMYVGLPMKISSPVSVDHSLNIMTTVVFFPAHLLTHFFNIPSEPASTVGQVAPFQGAINNWPKN